MLIPAFHLNLNEKIQRGQATVGKYDGKHPCLTCATTAGKIFLHNPHQSGVNDSHVTYLNINKQITAVVAGRMAEPGPQPAKDVLLVGTQSTLQCYDVDSNRDLFFKDVPDGINVVVVGRVGLGAPLAIVGGNCSIQGFSSDGSEEFWTVTGDNVSAMAFCDVDGDGRHELLVGSDDFDLRVFRGEDIAAELPEADQFVGLCEVQGRRFGYALVNGTIGMYEGVERVWRVKSKHSVCCVTAYDLDGDGVPELISGWGNGRVEVRRADTGEVVYRDHMACAVSALLRADYRNDGMEELIAAGLEGEVRGYLPVDARTAGSGGEVASAMDFSQQQSLLAELAQRKQELTYELEAYTAMKNTDRSQVDRAALIPPDTRINSFVSVNREAGCLELLLRSNNEAVIRGVVVFGEQIFGEESHFVYPKSPETQLAVPLRPLKDVPVVLMVKVLVGHRTSTSFHVFELETELPKFAMHAPVEKGTFPEPTSGVAFSLSERVARLAGWVEARFNVKSTQARPETLEAHFVSLRDQSPLLIKATPLGSTVQVVFRTESMDLAGDLVQDMAAHLGLAELQSTAEFPAAMATFKDVLTDVDEHNVTRLRLNADMADGSNAVKALLIRAEDVRLLGDMPNMKQFYRRLYDLNRDLIAEHEKRATAHALLMAALKEVNQMIQRAARLRVGNAKAKVINACRAAIKANNTAALFKIIRDGDG